MDQVYTYFSNTLAPETGIFLLKRREEENNRAA